MQADITEIKIDEVGIGTRPRTDDGDLSVLENSVRAIGLLHPIVLDQQNTLIAGGRRLQACRNLGLSTIAARKLEISADGLDALNIQTDENLCRRELSREEMNALIAAKGHAAHSHGGLRRIGDVITALKNRFCAHQSA